MTEPIHVISLGAGVQSSALALMAAEGLVTPMPVAAVFADTQAEPASVYRWLEWLEKRLPFPVYRVTAGDLAKADSRIRRSRKTGLLYRTSMIPAFTSNGGPGAGGILPRRCTRDFKVAPVLRKVRELAGIKRGGKVLRAVQWMGISIDEYRRMKQRPEAWVQNRWPLIDLRMTRQDCLRWFSDRRLPAPPRSACVFCPYHNDQEWVRLKREEPEEFARAVAFEKDIQAAVDKVEGRADRPFLHASRKPLAEVVFDEKSPQGILNGFNNDCEGMCGN